MRSLTGIFLSLIFVFAGATAQAKDNLPHFARVNEGIIRGGRPTTEGLQWLADNGVRTVINLEQDRDVIGREQEKVESLGMNFYSSPMSWRRAPSDEQIDFLMSLLTNPDAHPIYIHCLHGQDRTGLVIGLYRVFFNSWSPARAYEEMLELHFHPEFAALDRYFRERTGLMNAD